VKLYLFRKLMINGSGLHLFIVNNKNYINLFSL